jgi:hypothetical protein
MDMTESTAEELLAQQAAALILATGEIPEAEVTPVVIETLTFMGKMVELFESEAPSVAKTAAVVLFVERMRMDRAGEGALRKVAAVVSAFQAAFAQTERAPS